jgi:hypothetical protein
VKEGALLEFLDPYGKMILKYFLQIGWEVSVQDRN